MTKISTQAHRQHGSSTASPTRSCAFIVTTFCRTWCRMTVEGRENVPATGAFLLAPSHRSILDTPIASGVTRRRMRFMGADKYWKNNAFGRLLTALGGFPVTRGTADREALKRCIAVLEQGEPLVLFPEGERKSGPIVQPLFDGRRLRRGQGRRTDRAGGNWWFRTGDAQGCKVHQAAQGSRGDRQAIAHDEHHRKLEGATRRRTPGDHRVARRVAAPVRHRRSPRRLSRLADDPTVRRTAGGPWPARSGLRRRTVRALSASTVAAHRHRPFRCPSV